MRSVRVLIAGVMLLGIVACSNSGPNPQVQACVDRGVAYFNETGSYPTLQSAPNTGRRAEDVARERCNRTTTAF